MSVPPFDVTVLGAGAAGMVCAAQAGKRGLRVLLIEHSVKAGRKILISGGGRCNFTNTRCTAQNFLSENPHFAKSALAGYTPRDFMALVDSHGIAWHEKELGQLFCDGPAQQIVTMLERECADAGVKTRLNTRVVSVEQADAGFRLRVQRDGVTEEISCRAVVVATGGLSIPKLGATGFGYELARQFGLRVVEPHPALVPLVFGEEEARAFAGLSGVALDAVVRAGKAKFRHRILFTHRGLSGPAVLQTSSYWQPGEELKIDLAPAREITRSMRSHPADRTESALCADLREVWPQRFITAWTQNYPPTSWHNAALETFERELHNWRFIPSATEGFEKAEVTAGGVDTNELHAKSLESKRVPGLYFIGEVVDVTGWLGGFNFQWAWSSAVAAAKSLATVRFHG